MDSIQDIKTGLKEEKLIIGTSETLKGLRNRTIARVYCSSNCSEKTKEELLIGSKLTGVEVIDTGLPSDELGALCKKSFLISVLGVKA